jgi:putative ABC transport system permease protein
LREAVRFLWSSRTYSLLMMIGLVIGIASVTVIYELGAGVRERVFSLMANMGFGADAMFVSSGGGRVGMRRPGAASRTITLEIGRAHV